jgi:hypothetical protein
VTISAAGLAMRVESVGNDQMKLIFRSRYGHIEKAALFFDFQC